MTEPTTTLPQAPASPDCYHPPASMLEGKKHGDVIWSRPLDKDSLAALSSARVNELVVYVSESVHGKPIAVSGIIALPKKAAPTNGYPVISWAHGTVGSADTAAPSRDVQGAAAHPYNAFPHILLNKFLDRGWAVLMTDYEGLGTEGPHPYLLGKSEARGILDIVLAARQLHPELSDQFAIVGHSQGGQAALFGAHYAPDWTPELTLRAVAALAPASAVGALVDLACVETEPEGGNAFVALFITGALAGDPSIKLEEVLTPDALERFAHVEKRARVELSQTDSWGGLAGTNLLRPEASASKDALYKQFEAMHPNLVIKVPIRISQAIADKRVNAALTSILEQQLKTTNGKENVLYRPYLRVAPTHDPEELGFHFGLIDTDSDEVTDWLAGFLPKVE
ncbi:alpha/beta hydrolase family protein [Hyalangium rubrum]|uniref:Alpha/beta fold hydrolase n=1 Tax=Hyalangium rubrum TaxID=3103134 RepID=A0ABU5HIC2_9BACT|nr:lipase family protein [Hyalangium sp. s54d21]MDY7232899.1 alpha/beta fold hydrolase [Hyalangium sp. s54d21]